MFIGKTKTSILCSLLLLCLATDLVKCPRSGRNTKKSKPAKHNETDKIEKNQTHNLLSLKKSGNIRIAERCVEALCEENPIKALNDFLSDPNIEQFSWMARNLGLSDTYTDLDSISECAKTSTYFEL